MLPFNALYLITFFVILDFFNTIHHFTTDMLIHLGITETEFSSTPKAKTPFHTFEATSCSKIFKNNLLQFRMFDELMELLPKVFPAELEEAR
jgi:hypothetical protein